METNNLLPVQFYQPGSVEKNLQIAEMAYKSGLLPSTLRSPQAVLYVMQRGASLGLDPFFAAENTFLINGKLMLSVHAFQALLIKAGVRWDVISNTKERAEVKLRREGFADLTSVFTDEDAKRAGLAAKDSYRAWPADVLYANAFRKGARKIAPDVLMGLSYLDEVELLDKQDSTVTEPPRLQIEAPAATRVRKKKQEEPASVTAEVVVSNDDEQKVTYDNHDYHKCEEQPSEDATVYCDIKNNSDHRALLKSVLDDMRVPQRWRIDNKDLIVKALETIPTDTAAIRDCMLGLLDATGGNI